MLKIATIFSGIGAIEQAALRLNINHKIIFACDNGGINLYKKNRFYFPNEINEEFKKLNKNLEILLNHKEEFYFNIEEKLNELDDKIKNSFNFIEKIELNYDIKNLLEHLKEVKPKKFSNIKNIESQIDKISFLLNLKKYLSNKITEEINSNFLFVLKKVLNEDIYLKETVILLKEISLELNKLDEIIDTQINIKKLSEIKSYEKKKTYIQNIYQAYETKNFVKKSYLSNYNLKEDDFHWNVSYLDGKEYKGKVDLFVGGSPCQSFSIAGKRKGLEDTRGTLFYEFIRLVKEIQPRFFIYENVKGLLNHDNGETWKIIKESFNELGYSYKDKVLNARHFGIPQNRERIFVLGFKNKSDFKKFSMIENKELTYLLKDFLLDNNNLFLPDENINFVDYKEKNNYKNLSHICFENWMDPLLLRDIQKEFVICKNRQKKKYTQINGNIMLTQRACQQYNLHGDFIEYDINKYFISEKVKSYILDTTTPFNTKKIENHINCDIAKAIVATSSKMHRITTDNYVCYGDEVPISKRKIRRLHPRECFRLMGFSDNFNIVVSDTQAYHQAGNSIVVDVLIGILKGIMII